MNAEGLAPRATRIGGQAAETPKHPDLLALGSYTHESRLTAMKRMICIGAQAIDVAEMTMPLPGFEMPCRRNSGPTQRRTFIGAEPLDQSATAQVQRSLFEEPVACPGAPVARESRHGVA